MTEPKNGDRVFIPGCRIDKNSKPADYVLYVGEGMKLGHDDQEYITITTTKKPQYPEPFIPLSEVSELVKALRLAEECVVQLNEMHGGQHMVLSTIRCTISNIKSKYKEL